jgi:hypothetical protein
MEEEVSDYGYSEIKLYLLDLDQKLLGVDLAFLFNFARLLSLSKVRDNLFRGGVERWCMVVGPSIQGKERLEYKIFL